MTKKILVGVAVFVVVAISVVVLWLRLSLGGGPMERKELVLSCGAGIRSGATVLIKAFEAAYPCQVIPSYEGSGQLLGKVVAGTGGDLFMPGAEFYADKAIEKGLADGQTKRIVAYFVPVLLVQKGNPRSIHTLADLKRNGIRVGLGDERLAAVGQVALEIFLKNSIAYEDIARNVVYKSGTADELGVAVQMGAVDVVVLWDTAVRHYAGHGAIVTIPPPSQNVLSAIPIVVLRSSHHPKEAIQFVEFVTSEHGKRILMQQGFVVSLPAESP